MENLSKSMIIESNELMKEIELKVFGKYGFTLLAFPCAGDEYDELFDGEFVKSVENYLINGLFRIVYVPTVENRIWKNHTIEWKDRSNLLRNYNNFLINELLPNLFRIAGSPSPIITFGCGESGFFAANTYFRHPDIFYGTIAIDAFYDLRYLCGFDSWDENCYFNSPLDFLPNLQEEYWLIHLRAKKQVHLIATEREDNFVSIEQNKKLSEVLKSKGITHNFQVIVPKHSDIYFSWKEVFVDIVNKYF
ncbi:MAG: hypothetical protein N2560_05880 [Ignavibacteria bacterium]|nr:hypothetical protein [Ignavibacteria bacterium]